MPHYRIYALNDSGSIAGGTDAECADDEAAIATAKLTSVDCAGMEVWSGSRLVGQIPSPADLPSGSMEKAHRAEPAGNLSALWGALDSPEGPFGMAPSRSSRKTT